MKKLVFLIFLAIGNGAFSQEFAPTGAIWHYTQSNPFQLDGWTYKTIESVSDIIIEGIQCKKMIEIERYYDDTLFAKNQYMYSENDSVFFFEDGAFHLLYDFGAEAGDTLILDYFWTFDGSPLKMIIDSTGVINVNGLDKKIQYITCGDGVMVEFGHEVIEGIGSTYFMFPVYDGEVNGPLRCYQDSIVGLYLSPYHPNYGWNHQDCAEIITGFHENEITNDIIIYPNPSSDWIHIIFRENRSNWFPDREIEIFNVFGEKVGAEKMPNITESYSHNISNLSKGLYLLVIRERQKVVYTGKFLIAR